MSPDGQMATGAKTHRKQPHAAPPSWWRKPVVYRYARAAHAYLSAFAFVALMFFGASGFLLNHPDWLKTETPSEQVETLRLPTDALAAATDAANPGPALAKLLKAHARTLGAYASAEFFEEEAMLRFAGVKGNTDIIVDLATGVAEIEVTQSGVMSIIRDLHRGKEAGMMWRLLIDVVALLTLCLSAIGFFLFFTIRFRLRASLKLIGASFAIMATIFLFFVS